MNASYLDLPASGFDAVWVVETSEHLKDKRQFMETCAPVLKPDGVLALSACVAVEEPTERQSELLAKVCHVLLLPSLATLAQYREWIRVSRSAGRSAEREIFRPPNSLRTPRSGYCHR